MHRPLNWPYGPTEAALEPITLAWAQDLPDTGVTVNRLSPGGLVYTDFVLLAVWSRAAEAAREPAIFLPPKRDSVLTMPWEVPTT